MFYSQPEAALFRIEHQHSDGSWSTLKPLGSDPHDAAAADPERDWARGHVYVCTTCEETVRVFEPIPEELGPSQAR